MSLVPSTYSFDRIIEVYQEDVSSSDCTQKWVNLLVDQVAASQWAWTNKTSQHNVIKTLVRILCILPVTRRELKYSLFGTEWLTALNLLMTFQWTSLQLLMSLLDVAQTVWQNYFSILVSFYIILKLRQMTCQFYYKMKVQSTTLDLWPYLFVSVLSFDMSGESALVV